jgi:hypothetical protein
MKTLPYLFLLMVLFSFHVMAQKDKTMSNSFPERQLTIEPGIGVHTNFGTDFLITNLIQRNLTRHLSLAAHSSFNINNITQRDFNFIKTEYNYSFNQKFGIGTSVYAKRSSHSFFFMAGAKYTAYKETLNHPDLDKVSSTVSAWSPDYGMMYSLKKGVKDLFFSFRVYIPLYPWPMKGSNIDYIDANLDNIALEAGIGIKIK